MSRTIRKRKETFESYYQYYFDNNFWGDETDKVILRVRYYTSSCKWYSHCLPKEFRNSVNRTRRRKDKREVFKAINLDGYEEQCSMWNCKDNNAWGYW